MLLIFSDIAGSEILLILAFILVFFGSKSIPGIARTMGRTMRQIRDASQDMQNEIKKSGLDIKKDLNLRGMLTETEQTLRQPMDQMHQDINEVVDDSRKSVKVPVVPPVQVEKPEVSVEGVSIEQKGAPEKEDANSESSEKA